jgi:hypothetical protein
MCCDGLIAIAIGTTGITTGTGIQSAQAQRGDLNDSHGNSFHDANGDSHTHRHASFYPIIKNLAPIRICI